MNRMKESEREKLKHFFDNGDPDEIFILEEEIASGSFGAVYKGKHAQTGKHYAVKIITPEEDEVLEDFMVEISVLKRCKHENIVGFFGSWIKGEELFIAMDLCEGGAVSDIFQVIPEPLSEDQIAIITRETLKGLVYLHSPEVGIIHRDIKGANILLTNNGDIKLVDFGVSAELKHAGDKRNTLIGTPYWMAPEVISNKTGNVPYDQKADIWSLGITLLELAEMNPPLHEIHPMKALMMIPMRDPPTFTHAEQWSKDFRDFVSQCLIKAPEKRKTAEEMLKHPFVVNCKGKPVLIDLINKRRKAEAKVNADEEGEDSSEDDVSSEEEEPLPAPPPKANMIRQEVPSDSPPVTPINPKKDTRSPSLSGSPSGNSNSTSSSPWQQPKKPTVNRPSPLLNSQSSDSSEKRDSPDDSLVKDERGSLPERSGSSFIIDGEVKTKTGTRRATTRASAANPNRPTYRTNRKLTKREIRDHERQIVTRQLMKQQLKELRTKQQQHLKEQERQQKQHQKEQEQLTSKFNNLSQQKQKQLAKDYEALVRRHKTELENTIRQQSLNQKNLQKQQLAILKNTLKQSETDSKKQEKEFKEQVKLQSKQHKELLKEKSKALSKKDVKVLKSDYDFQLGWQDLIFAQKQGRVRQQQEYDKKQQLYEEQSKSDREQLEEKIIMQSEHLEQEQKVQSDMLQQNQLINEQLQQQQPLELKQLQETQELERQQLVEQQQVEHNQQKQLLLVEFKNQTREFRKLQVKDQLELAQQLKLLSKDKNLGKKEAKQKADELKKYLQQKIQKQNQEFSDKQQKQSQDEEDMIRTHQVAKQEQKKREHETQLKELKEKHETQTKKAQEEHQLAEKELLEKQQKERQALQEEQHKAIKDFQDSHLQKLQELLKEYQSEQQRLLDAHHQEQLQYKQKQKADEQETQKVQAEQEEEKKVLQQKQQKEQDMFLQQTELDKQHLLHELQTLNRKGENNGWAFQKNSIPHVGKTHVDA